jgi:hypothetical protein
LRGVVETCTDAHSPTRRSPAGHPVLARPILFVTMDSWNQSSGGISSQSFLIKIPWENSVCAFPNTTLVDFVIVGFSWGRKRVTLSQYPFESPTCLDTRVSPVGFPFRMSPGPKPQFRLVRLLQLRISPIPPSDLKHESVHSEELTS